MNNLEEQYIKNLDRPPVIEVGDQGKNAEKVVLKLLGSMTGMDTRPATPLEDSGRDQIVKDKAIDIVGYMDGRPAIGFQVTTATDSKARYDKSRDLLDRPFMRLPEMTAQETAIPRSLIYLDAAEVAAFLADNDVAKHPKLIDQLIESNLNSLNLDLTRTKNPKEQELIHKLISFFEESRLAFHEKNPDTIH